MSTASPNDNQPIYHVVKLDSGIEFAYTDSGAPSSAKYTTLITLHGAGFISKDYVRTISTQALIYRHLRYIPKAPPLRTRQSKRPDTRNKPTRLQTYYSIQPTWRRRWRTQGPKWRKWRRWL